MSLIKTYLHWVEEEQETFMKLRNIKIKERWVPVEGHPDFMLSSEGKVWSRPRKGTKGGDLKLFKHKTGYWGYKVGKNFYPLHLLMGRHFIPNPEGHPCVLHKNDDKDNNTLENLYWGTHTDNSYDKWDNTRNRQTYTFTLTTGEKVTTDNLSRWCNERGVPLKRVSSSIYRGQPINPTPGKVDKWGNRR